MKPKVTKIFLLVFVNLLVIGLGFELYFRYLYDTTDILNYGLSSQKWYQRHVQINSAGFRDDEYDSDPLHQKKDTVTVFFIGDSFTFGLGIKNTENRYSNLVCEALRKEIPNLKCYNLSFHGWDLKNYVDTLKQYAQEFEAPDAVVFQYFMNDIEIYVREATEENTFSATNLDSLMSYVHAVPQNALLKFLYHKSYAFNFFYLRYRLFSSSTGSTYEEVLLSDYADTRKFNLIEKELDRADLLAQEFSTQIGFVVFPLMDASRKAYKLNEAHGKIARSLNIRHVPFVDLTHTFWQYGVKQLIVNPFDAHPNEKANKLAAEEVVYLVANLLEKQALSSTDPKFKSINACRYYQVP